MTRVEAQGFRVAGSVVRVQGTDTIPVAGDWASLHEVTALGGVVLDSQLTSVSGAFGLVSPRGDSAATYLVAVEHHSIAYFSDPFRSTSIPTPTLLVYDTSSVEPPVLLGERHVILQPIEQDGTRRIIELWLLRNDGALTRVAPDTGQPVWETAVPTDAVDFEVAAADVSADAVYQRGNTIAVAAPIPPGERQILVTYLLPRNARTWTLPVDQQIPLLNVLVADSGATVTPAMVFEGWETVEGVPYRRFTAQPMASGVTLQVTARDLPLAQNVVVLVVVSLFALALVSAWVVWSRGRAPTAMPVDGDPEALAAKIAALDRAAGDRDDAQYALEREAMKQRLVDALAKRRDQA